MAMIPPNLRPDFDLLRADLAAETLRNIVKDGWTLLDMASGIADAFPDATGISALGGATHDPAGKYLHNLTAEVREAAAVPSLSAYLVLYSGTAASFNDNSASTCAAINGDLTGKAYDQRPIAVLDLGAVKTVTKIEAELWGGGAVKSGYTLAYSADGASWTQYGAAIADFVAQTTTVRTGAGVLARYVAVIGPAGLITSTYVYRLNAYTVTALSVAARSISFVPAAPASAVRVVALWQPLDATTLGTDCRLVASTNGGAAYANVPLLDLGKFDASTRIIGGVATVAAGSAVRWGWDTANNKSQRLRGVWVQWR